MGKNLDAIAALFAAITDRKPPSTRYAPDEDYAAFWENHQANAETLAAQRKAELDFMPKFLRKCLRIRLRIYDKNMLHFTPVLNLSLKTYVRFCLYKNAYSISERVIIIVSVFTIFFMRAPSSVISGSFAPMITMRRLVSVVYPQPC